MLDTETTPELEAEGLARDVIRAVQDTRKAAGLEVSDRISLAITGDRGIRHRCARAFAETISGETLALATTFVTTPNPEVDAALSGQAGAHRAVLTVAQYANAGVLVIDVVKSGAINV